MTHNPNLTWIDCPYSNLTSIDLSNNMKLVELRLEDNHITTLDISACPQLVAMVKPENLDNEDEYVRYSISSGDNWYWLSYDKNVQLITQVTSASDFTIVNGVVTAYNGAGGAIEIPATDGDGNAVVAIGEEAFRGNDTITAVSIPVSVTSVGESAFEDCSALESVTIPNSVTIIGDWAFRGCNMMSVTIPNSVTDIGEYAFEDCISLTSVTIGSSVMSIGERVFGGCINLTSIDVESENNHFSSLDGVLLTRNKRESSLVR